MRNQFHKNAEQVLGSKHNVLLVRDGVGFAKPSTRNLPKPGFAYGKQDLLPDR